MNETQILKSQEEEVFFQESLGYTSSNNKHDV